MMGAWLVMFVKEPGTIPLGIGEYWRQGTAKCALKGCDGDTKAAFGSTQLCAGLKANIEGALHAVSLRATEHDTIEFGE